MEGESRELSDAGVVGRPVGANGVQRQRLAPGMGAGGDFRSQIDLENPQLE